MPPDGKYPWGYHRHFFRFIGSWGTFYEWYDFRCDRCHELRSVPVTKFWIGRNPTSAREARLFRVN